MIETGSPGETRNPEPGRSNSWSKTKLTITTLATATSARAKDARGAISANNREVAGAGVASSTASTRSSPALLRSSHRSRSRSSPRTITSVRTSASPAAIAAGSRPTPPRMPAKTGEPSGSGSCAAAASGSAPRAFNCSPAAARDNRSESPAYTPANKGATSRSSTCSPARSRTYSATEMSWSGSGTLCCSTETKSTGPVGMPITVRGSGCNEPSARIDAWVVSGCTMSDARPTASARATASGRRASIDSAPTSSVRSPTVSRRSLPPRRSVLSNSTGSSPCSCRARAAARPAMPPPTMAMRINRRPSGQSRRVGRARPGLSPAGRRGRG